MTESSHNLTGVKTILSVRAHRQHLFVLDKMILTLIIILFSARSTSTTPPTVRCSVPSPRKHFTTILLQKIAATAQLSSLFVLTRSGRMEISMTKNKKKESSLIWSIREISNFDKSLLVILLFEIVVNSLLPFPSIIFGGVIVNAIMYSNNFGLVIMYVAIMFGMTYLLNMIHLFLGKRKEYLLIKLTDKIVNDLNAKCMTIDYEQFNDSATLDRIHAVYRTARGNNFFTSLTIVCSIISKLITLVGVASIITHLNVVLLLVIFIVIVLQTLLQIIRVKNNKKYNLDSMADQRRLTFSSDLPTNIEKKKDVIMYDLGGLIIRKLKSFQKAMLIFNKRRIKDSGILDLIAFTLTIAFQISAYILLGINTFYGQITIGDFTVGISSLVTFMSASTFLTTNLVNYNDSMFYINRHKSFFKIRSKFNLKSKITIDDIDLENVEIEFKNVSFRYPNSTSFVLKNINLKLNAQEKLAIVGYNGAGKTSFILLLTRMYDPTDGTICLNGIDIRDIEYSDYLKIFATVNQDFALLPFSILENIAGRETVTPEEEFSIEQLFKDNGMGTRLEKLYKGLDTPVTKVLSAAGVDFSGGEMQKIAIIRALFKNSPILILDEPTSALDPMAEYEIYQKFSKMSDGKLTVYISHRISSTRFCDRIAVFDKGEIVECGTFDELMGKKGLYYDFFEKQAEYFKWC